MNYFFNFKNDLSLNIIESINNFMIENSLREDCIFFFVLSGNNVENIVVIKDFLLIKNSTIFEYDNWLAEKDFDLEENIINNFLKNWNFDRKTMTRVINRRYIDVYVYNDGHIENFMLHWITPELKLIESQKFIKQIFNYVYGENFKAVND